MANRIEDAARISLRLLENILRIHGNLFRFDDPEQMSGNKQRVVGRAVRRGQFFNGNAIKRGKIQFRGKFLKLPTLLL